MFNSLQSFLDIWQDEAASTQLIFDALTDESLNQTITPEHRSIGRLAWHIVTTLDEMTGHAGLKFDGAALGSGVPSTAAEISDAYQRENEAMVKAIREQWSDATLFEERDMYGVDWTIGNVLWVLITHQIHHRAQITVLMRQAGLMVPGLYGPSKEDWLTRGSMPPEV